MADGYYPTIFFGVDQGRGHPFGLTPSSGLLPIFWSRVHFFRQQLGKPVAAKTCAK
jgi:hypothetical protein